ncbi:DNA repair protein rad8 [Paramyrothecium foliicola]|nr:DNA repair protein rad8 [Paramyrothecium foliicola]
METFLRSRLVPSASSLTSTSTCCFDNQPSARIQATVRSSRLLSDNCFGAPLPDPDRQQQEVGIIDYLAALSPIIMRRQGPFEAPAYATTPQSLRGIGQVPPVNDSEDVDVDDDASSIASEHSVDYYKDLYDAFMNPYEMEHRQIQCCFQEDDFVYTQDAEDADWQPDPADEDNDQGLGVRAQNDRPQDAGVQSHDRGITRADGSFTAAWLEKLRSVDDAKIFSVRTQGTMDTIRRIREGFPNEKIIVVSQFVLLLDIVKEALRRMRSQEVPGQTTFACDVAEFNGTIKKAQDRTDVIKTFSLDNGPEILLLSVGSGGTGLNITAASHIILSEPLWSPALKAPSIWMSATVVWCTPPYLTAQRDEETPDWSEDIVDQKLSTIAVMFSMMRSLPLRFRPGTLSPPLNKATEYTCGFHHEDWYRAFVVVGAFKNRRARTSGPADKASQYKPTYQGCVTEDNTQAQSVAQMEKKQKGIPAELELLDVYAAEIEADLDETPNATQILSSLRGVQGIQKLPNEDGTIPGSAPDGVLALELESWFVAAVEGDKPAGDLGKALEDRRHPGMEELAPFTNEERDYIVQALKQRANERVAVTSTPGTPLGLINADGQDVRPGLIAGSEAHIQASAGRADTTMELDSRLQHVLFCLQDKEQPHGVPHLLPKAVEVAVLNIRFRPTAINSQQAKETLSMVNDSGTNFQWSSNELDVLDGSIDSLAVVVGELLPVSAEAELDYKKLKLPLKTSNYYFNTDQHAVIFTKPDPFIVVRRITTDRGNLFILINKGDDGLCSLSQFSQDMSKDRLAYYSEWVTEAGLSRITDRKKAWNQNFSNFIQQWVVDNEDRVADVFTTDRLVNSTAAPDQSMEASLSARRLDILRNIVNGADTFGHNEAEQAIQAILHLWPSCAVTSPTVKKLLKGAVSLRTSPNRSAITDRHMRAFLAILCSNLSDEPPEGELPAAIVRSLEANFGLDGHVPEPAEVRNPAFSASLQNPMIATIGMFSTISEHFETVAYGIMDDMRNGRKKDADLVSPTGNQSFDIRDHLLQLLSLTGIDELCQGLAAISHFCCLDAHPVQSEAAKVLNEWNRNLDGICAKMERNGQTEWAEDGAGSDDTERQGASTGGQLQ